MSPHDPFGGDSDRTIMKPTGGGLGAQPPQTPASPQPAQPPPDMPGDVVIAQAGSNPLLIHSAPLFALANQLRSSVTHPDPLRLQAHVAQDIVNFENRTRQAGEAQETVLAARYVLCTVIDEFALSTPWGVESQWASQTLLVRFHNEASGGEKFFQILERLLTDPQRNLHLLEFMYVCLSIGFEGKYRLTPRGPAELEQIRLSLFETIRTFRGTPPRELSLTWRGVEYKTARLAKYVPLWVLGLVGAGLCLAIYIALLFTLNTQSDPLVTNVAGLARDAVPIETRLAMPPPVVRTQTLSQLLSSDQRIIAAADRGELEIEEQNRGALVRLWGVFPSGQASVSPDAGDVINVVARALSEFSGRVQVIGHTDNQPIRSIQFPSNWILSERRAEAVLEQLEFVLDTDRLSAEGKADTEALASNDSAEGRARNRRIEVKLFYEVGEL